MYNQVYINEFDESAYIKFLSNPAKLSYIKDAYLNQYNDKSDSFFLAFKESLDHYVKKKLLEDDSFINTREFQNYLIYVLQIVDSKEIKITDNNTIHPEILTNVVFRDEKLREKIIDIYFEDHEKLKYGSFFKKAERSIDLIFKALESNQKVNQELIDIAGDYLYSSRNLSDNRGQIFAKYILNNSERYNIKSSVQILGAMTAIFIDQFSLDDEVKSSRFYIASYDSNNRITNIAFSKSDHRYCVLQKDKANVLSLTSSKSLFMSRSFKDLDIYWLMFVTYHELTHQHQRLDMDRQKLTTSGLSYVINKVLIKYMPTGTYNNKLIHDYNVNHDGDEIEMEADEEGWRQTRKTIHAFVDREKRYVYDEQGNKEDMWFLAQDNEKTIQARRTFTTKKDVELAIREKDLPKEKKSQGMYYAAYDLLHLDKIVKEHPEALKEFPLLKQFFDDSGKMKSLSILSMNIYKNSQQDDISRNSINNAGLEIGTYVLNHKWNDVLKSINEGRIRSRKEIDLISNNIYHIVHNSVLKVRSFNSILLDESKKKTSISIDPKQYNETVLYYNLHNKNNTKELYEYYFKCVAMGTLRFYHYRELIKKKYNIVIDDQFMYFSSYVYELYNKLIDKNDPKCMNALEQFKLSNEPHLLQMYNTIMENKKINIEGNKAK